MKKILFGLVVLFIGTQLMTSCSSESNVLSQFSKRKYMKRFKTKDLKYKDEINERENSFTAVEKVEERTYASVEMKPTTFNVEEVEALDNSSVVVSAIKKSAQQEPLKVNYTDYSERKSFKPFVDFSTLGVNSISKLNSEKPSAGNMSDATLLLGILLWVLYPIYPLSVLLSDSDKFLLDFAFYALGLILVLSGVAADNVAIAVIGGIVFFVGWIYALIMLAKSA